MQNKGQMELFGLALVMLLIAFGIFFGILFFQENDETTLMLRERSLAAQTINTIIHTTTECEGRVMKDLMQDCAAGGVLYCGSENSCEFIRTEITNILEELLGKKNKQYHFSIERGAERINMGKECKGERARKISPFLISSGITVDIRLDIC